MRSYARQAGAKYGTRPYPPPPVWKPDGLTFRAGEQQVVWALLGSEDGSVRNTVLDSGRADEVVVDETVNAFRATPSVG